jgi:hypothetical protein
MAALSAGDNYRVFLNDKGRETQQPIGELGRLHDRIGQLLARVATPDYVYSKRRRSYADNAAQHLGHTPLIKADIHRFYPSTTRAMVYRLFLEDFGCAADIANRLADLCCYQREHLPTGSALSGRIAFLAARSMFDEVKAIADREKCKMTAYVDDIAVSGDRATTRLLGEIRQVVSRHGLKTKARKCRTYSASSPKELTGTVIVGGELRLPNARHWKIWQKRKELETAAPSERAGLARSLSGRLQEAKQILCRPSAVNPSPPESVDGDNFRGCGDVES